MNELHPLYIQDLENIINSTNLEALNDKTMLITGSTGLIGTVLIDALMMYNSNGGNVHIIAAGRSTKRLVTRFSHFDNDDHLEFLEQDSENPFPQSLSPDYIFPLASNTHPLAYSKFPVETMLINLKGAEYALELARICGATVLYPSTVEVYGNARGQEYFTEDYTGKLNLSNSRACYTESKRASEALCQSYISEFNVKVKIARLSRVFGPSVKESDTKASSQFIKKALVGEDIVLKSEGNQYFSYTYVADAVSAMMCILLKGENGKAYNISNEKCNVHLRDFAQVCADCAKTKVIFDLPSETERKGYSTATTAILDNSRLKSIGWKPMYSFKNAVERTIKILKDIK